MNITLNGKVTKIDNITNINTLLLSHSYEDKMIAIAINGTFVPKSSYETHIINDQDDIEIVAPMQGG